jgi:hypothetical protein
VSTPSDTITFAPTYAPWYMDAAALLAEPDPGPTPWLVDQLIVDRALVAVVGRWKTTKWYGVLDLCIAVATGRPAFGTFAVPEPGPVVFVNEESGKAALWRRLDALCRGRAIDPEELRGRLFVAPNAGVKLDDEEWQDRICGLYALRPRLIVFDPLARMKAPTRDESAQKEMAGVVEFMRDLRERHETTVLFVHHTGHQGEHMRGSSDLESAWETRLRWKRDGQASVVTVESEHREAEAAPGSESGNHPGTTPSGQRAGSGSPAPGTTPTDPLAEVVPNDGNTGKPCASRRAVSGCGWPVVLLREAWWVCRHRRRGLPRAHVRGVRGRPDRRG